MQDYLLQLFKEYNELAIVISLVISILIALLGLVPSVFVTAANILFFGFWEGFVISFLGESIGAGIAFLVYRTGFKKKIESRLINYPKLMRLINAENKEAFYLIFLLRLIPFIPSGLITFAASIGKVSFTVFLISSSLGKIPALLFEAISVYEIIQFSWLGKLILAVAALLFIFWIIRLKK